MKRVLIISTLTIACLFYLALGVKAETFCVSNATDFQNALTEATSNGGDDTIEVVQGTYTGNFTYDSSEGKNISLLGGYAQGCTDRVVDPENTILDGGGIDSVLRFDHTGSGDTNIEGFTIRNGNAEFRGGGIYIWSKPPSGAVGSITVTNNLITGNTSGVHGGGGIYVYLESESGTVGNITLTNNIITANTSTGNNSIGAGIYVSNLALNGTAGNITVTNNIIMGNSADYAYYGAGVTVFSGTGSGTAGDVIVINNVITGNTTNGANARGGGIFARSTHGDLGTAGTVFLTNNTITANTATGDNARAGGAYLYSHKEVNVYNNIIWANTANSAADISISSITPISNGYNNDYSGDVNWTSSGNNINTDPLFVNPNNGDYHLQSTSPCIDIGTNSAPHLPTTDFEGNQRVADGDSDGTETVDMGADEFFIAKGEATPWIPLLLLDD
jgi:hypothetical protein